MNRKVLFRGKRIDAGEWIKSSTRLVSAEGEIYLLSDTDDEASTNTVEDIYGNIRKIEADGRFLFAKVDPETVGQYTGLKDRNGKRIFEGDIVTESSGDMRLLCDIGVRKRSHIGVVKFGIHEVPSEDPYCWSEAYGFYVCGDVFTPAISMYRPTKENWGNGFNLEIIGNIHDNQWYYEPVNE